MSTKTPIRYMRLHFEPKSLFVLSYQLWRLLYYCAQFCLGAMPFLLAFSVDRRIVGATSFLGSLIVLLPEFTEVLFGTEMPLEISAGLYASKHSLAVWLYPVLLWKRFKQNFVSNRISSWYLFGSSVLISYTFCSSLFSYRMRDSSHSQKDGEEHSEDIFYSTLIMAYLLFGILVLLWRWEARRAEQRQRQKVDLMGDSGKHKIDPISKQPTSSSKGTEKWVTASEPDQVLGNSNNVSSWAGDSCTSTSSVVAPAHRHSAARTQSDYYDTEKRDSVYLLVVSVTYVMTIPALTNIFLANVHLVSDGELGQMFFWYFFIWTLKTGLFELSKAAFGDVSM